METVLIGLVERAAEDHHHELGTFQSFHVPRVGEFLEWEGCIFKVMEVIWTPNAHSGFVGAVVSVKFNMMVEVEGESDAQANHNETA